MTPIPVTALDIAMRFVGTEEVEGVHSNPQVLAMLQLDQAWPQDDEVAWCSAFVNYVAWLLRLPRSKNLAARSWLNVGLPVDLERAEAGFDVVILRRGDGAQPGPEVINAPGHVGFFAKFEPTVSGAKRSGRVHLLGGNQGDMVNVSSFDAQRVLGVRRLAS